MIRARSRTIRTAAPAAAPLPPPSSKPTAAAVLDAKGYSLAWQDRLGETDAPTDDRQFFGAYTGARVSEDPPDGYPNENNRRLSFVTFDGKPCLKSIYRAGEHGWLNFRSMVLPQRYRKIGLAVDVFVPTAFELLNSSGATISGKTMFGLVIGHPDHQRPGVLPGWAPNVPSRSWRGAVCVPEDQLGAECGINWTYRNTTGAFEFDIYAHVPGRRANGVYYPRMDAFSNIYAISGVAASPKVPVPRGRWFTLTLLAEIDTNAGDGVLEMWYDNVLVASVTGIDLGGWVGDRGLYKGRTKTAAPSGMADTDTNRQQYSFGFGDLSNTALGQYAWNKGGWRGQGIFIRDMIGGVTADPAKVPRTTSAYYAHNWRVKGVVWAAAPLPPPVGDELSVVRDAHTLSAVEEFDGATLNAARWRVLGEPGRGQSSALAPVLEWPDHWGKIGSGNTNPNYIHDPAAVSLSNSVLRLGWRYVNGVWSAGGITSANSYGAPRGSMFLAPSPGLVEFRFRVPALPVGSAAFYAVWRMPRDDGFGTWPASGEIDDFEGTQHPDGVAVNGSGRNAYANLPNNWGSPAGINFAGNSGTLSPAINLLDGQWHTGATWQRSDGAEELLSFYLDGRLFHTMRVPAAYAARVRVPFVWLLTAQGPGFWGAGLPDNDALTHYVFEVDWIKQYVPTVVVPTPSGKPTTAPILEAKGLSFIGQDTLGTANEPGDSTNFFAPNMGSRNTNTDLGQPAFNRLSIVTFDGKRCLEDSYHANRLIQLNYRTARLPARYREFGICCDVYYPPSFAPSPQKSGAGAMHGKTFLGMTMGHPQILVPNFQYGWRTEVCFPEDMWGGMLGVNWGYRFATGNVEYGLYCHTVGGYANGQDVMRSAANLGSNGAYSHPVPGLPGLNVTGKVPVPKGRWFRFEMYVRMDTNRRDGLIEWYVDGVRQQSWEALDLGGWVGSRGLYRGKSAPAGASSATASAGDGALSSDCDPAYRTYGGFRLVGPAMRSMGGGYSLDPTLIPTNDCRHYMHNLRWYGKV